MWGRLSTIYLYLIRVLIHICTIDLYIYMSIYPHIYIRREQGMATTEASADSSASSIYPYIYIRGEQGMAADSASSTETSGLGLLRPR